MLTDFMSGHLNSNIHKYPKALALHKMTVSYEKKFKYIFHVLDRHVIREGLQIADFGCGPGYALVDLNKRYEVSFLYGIDSMFEAIESARDLIRRHNIEYKTKLIQMNLVEDEIPIPEQSIDIAIASQLIHTLSLPIQVIVKISKVMKPDGIFVVFDWVRFSLDEAFEMWGRKGDASSQAYHNWLRFSRFNSKDLFQILSLGGFKTKEAFDVPWYGDGKPLSSGKYASILLIAKPDYYIKQSRNTLN